MKYYYEDVPGIGNLVLTRHAQHHLSQGGVTDEQVQLTLANGHDIKDGQSVIIREWRDIRLVIETRPNPMSGACVALTGYRMT